MWRGEASRQQSICIETVIRVLRGTPYQKRFLDALDNTPTVLWKLMGESFETFVESTVS